MSGFTSNITNTGYTKTLETDLGVMLEGSGLVTERTIHTLEANNKYKIKN